MRNKLLFNSSIGGEPTIKFTVQDITSGTNIWLQVTKAVIQAMDFTDADNVFKIFKQAGKKGKGNLHISFNDYDDVPEFICEIPEVRKWVQELFNRHPYIMYFLNNETYMLNTMLVCLADINLLKKKMAENSGKVNAVVSRETLNPIINGTLAYTGTKGEPQDKMIDELISTLSFLNIKD